MTDKLNAQIYEIDSKDWITKSNTIIESQYKLTLQEQRILLITASKVQPSDEDFKPYKFRVTDLVDKIGISSQTSMYSYIKSVVKGLQGKTVEFKKDNKTIVANWLVTSIYAEQEGTVILKFNPDLKEFFLQLKERFTSYQLENVIQLNSVYSIRIYELLKQYESLRKRTFTIEELREKLGIEKSKYKQYGHLKDRVINAAKQELAEKTDISFTFQEVKKGRKVTGIIFQINSKKNNSSPIKEIPHVIVVPGDQEREQSLRDRLTKLKVKKELFDYLFNTYSLEQIKRNIEYAEKRASTISSIGGYTYKAICSDYAKSLLDNNPQLDENADSAAILKYLTDYWNRTNEPLQSWFVEEKSVEELQIKLELDPAEANTKFEIIKEPLFQALNITVSETQQLSFDELDVKREDVKKRLEKYKKSTI
ncbi:replication initiation protein [Bacillus infantis]|uniref:replication initiation protein n=1 Tax=Bacillus infantis TaxID=324767 RepID=UPI00209CC010|nr:replication initiation protein [Bacillus infantis]MCP1161353.1 replication initiation protein [Bacillus infantis]